MAKHVKPVRLLREHDQIFLWRDGEADRTPVRPVWARPITARGREVSFLDRDKQEVLMLESLDLLDSDSRRIAEEELEKRYLSPRVTRVIRTRANFGVHYWYVETDMGERRFALKHASKNAVWVSDDHLVLRDTLGCRYEINPFSGLDPRSLAEAEKVL